MNTMEESFYAEVYKAFDFLVVDYGYTRNFDTSKLQVDPRDFQIDVLYTNSSINLVVNIFWIPSVAQIDIGFIELHAKSMSRDTPVSYFGNYSGNSHGILLRMYAEMIGHTNDPDFLLKNQDVNYGKDLARRKRLIENGTQPIIEGLARATRRYTGAILLGDTSMFLKVLQYTHDR